MFYLFKDSISLDTLTTCSVLEARSFMSTHPNAWALKSTDDGDLSYIFTVEDL